MSLFWTRRKKDEKGAYLASFADSDSSECMQLYCTRTGLNDLLIVLYTLYHLCSVN